jgi:NitT/TauT family transport system permease protein
LIGAIVGEFIGAMEGLGNLILVAFNVVNVPLMFAAIGFVVIIALCMYTVVVFAERVLVKWRPSQRMR